MQMSYDESPQWLIQETVEADLPFYQLEVEEGGDNLHKDKQSKHTYFSWNHNVSLTLTKFFGVFSPTPLFHNVNVGLFVILLLVTVLSTTAWIY